MKENLYRIGELAEKANVTKRTIRYYIGRRLLPPPDGAGAGTTYSDEHLYRIMLIKKLQEAYLPLEEIKKRVIGLSLEEVKKSIDSDCVNNDYVNNDYVNNDHAKNNYINNEKEILDIQVCNDGVESYQDNSISIVYERILLGYGVEIHYPGEDSKARKLAESLYRYAEKILKEG